MDNIQGLRRLSLKLEVSGTAVALSNTKLYQGGFGFVLLSVLVPVTQNALGSPLLTVYRTTIDSTGQRVQYNTDNYTLLFVQYLENNGNKYMLFEGLLPRVFTDTKGDLELVFNYIETKQVDNGDGTTKTVIVSRLTTNIYRTYVEAGGVAYTGIVIDDSSSLLANQVNANTIAITQLQDDLDNVINIVIPSAIHDHNIDEDSHPYLLDLINSIDLGEGMTIPAVQDKIDTSVQEHNTSDVAHEDIRQEISDGDNNLQEQVDTVNSEIVDIQTVIPSVANIDNKLVDRLTMIQAIVTNTTRFLTYDSSGSPFPTFADLSSAIVWYYQGASTAPTSNDFTVVLQDENHDNATVQYSYDGTQWVFMFKVSDVAFTQAQWDAVNSGASSSLVSYVNSLQGRSLVDTTTLNNTLQNYATQSFVTTNFATKAQVDYMYEDYITQAKLDSALDTHRNDDSIHVTQQDKDNWNAVSSPFTVTTVAWISGTLYPGNSATTTIPYTPERLASSIIKVSFSNLSSGAFGNLGLSYTLSGSDSSSLGTTLTVTNNTTSYISVYRYRLIYANY